jgi:hypothetical protein
MERAIIRERADRAYHDVAQLHLSEFADGRELYPTNGRT